MQLNRVSMGLLLAALACGHARGMAVDGVVYAPGHTATTLESGPSLTLPRLLAADGQHMYWVDISTDPAHGTMISSAPLSGGAPRTLAYFDDFINAMALAGDELYVLTAAEEIWRVPVSGADAVLLFRPWAEGKDCAYCGGVGGKTMAVDGGYVYFCGTHPNDGGLSPVLADTLMRIPLGAAPVGPVGTAAATTIVTSIDCSRFVLVDDHLYWVGDQGLGSVPTGGGAATILDPAPTSAEGIASDGTNVYFTEHGRLSIFQPDWSVSHVVATGLELPDNLLFVDADNAYLTDSASGIVEVSLTDGRSSPLVTIGPAVLVTGMTLFGSALYFGISTVDDAGDSSASILALNVP